MIAIALLIFSFALPLQATELRDATGARIEAKGEPARIVTLAPSLGELAADLEGAQLERIVGVSEYTDYPPSLKKVQSIGPYNRFSLEKVMALKPDLVLGTKDGNAEDQIQHLRELGLHVVVVDTTSFDLIQLSMRQVGAALGKGEEGEKLARAFEKALGLIRARAQGRPSRKVLIQLGDEPLIVAGREAFLSEALRAVGADNAYADSPGRYPRPSVEDAVSRNPDAILILAMGEDLAPFKKMADHWKRFNNLKAVKDKRVRLVVSDALLRPTMRLLGGLKLLEQGIYGP